MFRSHLLAGAVAPGLLLAVPAGAQTRDAVSDERALKGPASPSSGKGALTGVINTGTRRPKALRLPDGISYTDAQYDQRS